MHSLGERILYIRKKNKLTQKDFADLINVARSSIGKLENDEVSPSAATLLEISKAFNVSIDWLITGENYSKNNEIIKYTNEEIVNIIENASDEDKEFIYMFFNKFKKLFKDN
ncbi:helix-turn-helix transcriptional regulator [Clostridium cochlearium]|uniref:Immunity repressor protein n=1 Tax=Clostridium cochlearium TaxID=1494 RepID=A0A2X2WCX6_CLOCO|nr:helix-turn-helix transcriptional regulator [Clostridium cochlearium]NME94581.1 helix-turn-helix transcriptional regulator [Clostridium cochlearium]SQB35513.1 immunity repressor protein [Clostridium cochlearium]